MQKGVTTEGFDQQDRHETHHREASIHPLGIAAPAESRHIEVVADVSGTDVVSGVSLVEVIRPDQERPKS